MHRAVLVVLALALAAPTASAVRDSLALSGPETVDASSGLAEVAMEVTLRVEDFYCPQARTFVVTLNATPDAGISVLVPPEVVLHVPEGSYLLQAYEANATFNVTVTAAQAGNVIVAALFEAAEGDCVAPGGFPTAQAAASLRVETNVSAAPPPTEVTPVVTNETEVAENSTNETAEPAPPTPTPAQATSCPPGPTCAYIGEYEPGTETVDESSLDTPFLGVALLAAAVAVALVVARKR